MINKIDPSYLADAKKKAATGQNTNTRPTYADQRKATSDQTKLAKESLALGYTNTLSQLGQNYAGQRNDAAVNAALQKKALQESMANMGLSGAGGTSQTLQLQRANNLNSNLANIGMAEQNAINSLDTQRQQSELQLTSDEIAANAKISAAEQAELLARDQFDRQMAFTEERANIDNAMELLSRNKITAAQFQQMTGITVQEAAKRSTPKTPTAQDMYQFQLELGIDPITAADDTGYAPGLGHNYGYNPATGKVVGMSGSIKKEDYGK